MRIAPSRLRKRSDLLVPFRNLFGRHGKVACRRLGVLVLLPPLIWMCATLTWQHSTALFGPRAFHSPETSSSDPSLLIRRTKHLRQQQQQQQSTSSSNVLRDTLLTLPHISAELVWKQLVEEGSHQIRHVEHKDRNTNIGVAMEVGMHTAKQCLLAAKAGFEVHCIEPSPVSFTRVQAAFNASIMANQQTKGQAVQLQLIRPDRVHLYQAAAGRTSDSHVDFVGRGGTGDHVGNIDVWNMRAGPPIDQALAAKQGAVQTVRTVALDDIIARKLKNGQDRAFVLKVDTQGYEPAVFSGLTHSIAHHKVSFLLFEYWPAGMDLMMQQSAANETCVAATLLDELLKAGYTLYALPVQSHPAAPDAAKRAIQDVQRMPPLDSVSAHCHYFYDVAKEFPSDTYKMGYWSDVLAVAPNVTLPVPPVTELAKLLLQ